MRGASLALTLALAGACTPTPQEQVQADMKRMRSEHSADKLFDRGRAFAQVGDLTRAEEYLVAALDQGKPAAVVLPELFAVCVRAGKYRVAVQYAEQHLARHPRDSSTRFVLGSLHAALGEGVEARRALEEVVRDRPRDARAYYALAVLMRDTERDPVSADRYFRRYLELEPRGVHADEARESLLKSVPQPPGDAGAREPVEAAPDGGGGAAMETP